MAEAEEEVPVAVSSSEGIVVLDPDETGEIFPGSEFEA